MIANVIFGVISYCSILKRCFLQAVSSWEAKGDKCHKRLWEKTLDDANFKPLQKQPRQTLCKLYYVPAGSSYKESEGGNCSKRLWDKTFGDANFKSLQKSFAKDFAGGSYKES